MSLLSESELRKLAGLPIAEAAGSEWQFYTISDKLTTLTNEINKAIRNYKNACSTWAIDATDEFKTLAEAEKGLNDAIKQVDRIVIAELKSKSKED